MKVSLITAMDKNRLIGANNQLPWHLPADLAWFKKNTLKKPVVMGRNTWESLPVRPLPGRDNIIVTRDSGYTPLSPKNETVSHTFVVDSISSAIESAENNAHSEVMFIGGASLYEQVLSSVDCLYLTVIEDEFKGDAWFPEVDFNQWQETFREDNEPDEKNRYHYSFRIYERKK